MSSAPQSAQPRSKTAWALVLAGLVALALGYWLWSKAGQAELAGAAEPSAPDSGAMNRGDPSGDRAGFGPGQALGPAAIIGTLTDLAGAPLDHARVCARSRSLARPRGPDHQARPWRDLGDQRQGGEAVASNLGPGAKVELVIESLARMAGTLAITGEHDLVSFAITAKLDDGSFETRDQWTVSGKDRYRRWILDGLGRRARGRPVRQRRRSSPPIFAKEDPGRRGAQAAGSRRSGPGANLNPATAHLRLRRSSPAGKPRRCPA